MAHGINISKIIEFAVEVEINLVEYILSTLMTSCHYWYQDKNTQSQMFTKIPISSPLYFS